MDMVQQPAVRMPLGPVSYTLLVTMKARRTAARCGLPADAPVRRAVDTYRSSGSQHDAIRAMRDTMHGGDIPGGAA